MVKKEDQECQEIARKLISFLNSLQDQKKKRLFIKETIYILFRLESLSDINAKYVDTMKENVKGANQGCFLLMVGIYCASKGDNQNALNYYTQSFEVFDTLNDELFMLLTTRLICNCYDQMKVRSKTRSDYEEAYEMLLKEPIFKDINVDILFENFDRRLELARTVAVADTDNAGAGEYRERLQRRPVQVSSRKCRRPGDDCT
jgi:tetratricopeptide (TPR) repeat protein